ncbi:MAG TPA: electron transfer flavoprotein beta subunit/FixA family protein, partial [Bacteroidia bacterium]|nr:electron transfer flavoprotein beta subunit/FixA family protein [Bacteroidia bacterium]
YDLVLVGKETINYNGSSVGAMIAGELDLPFVSLATKLDISGTKCTLEQEIEGGTQVVECNLPLIVSCAKGMAEQRIPNMRGIMAARSKPLEVAPSTAGEALTSIKSFTLNPGRTTCKMMTEDQMDQLVALLHTEAKVI